MKKQQGISMIEVLVTIIVLSFGFLSLASFQMGTLRHLSGSNQNYLATSLAASIGESIRANGVNAASYNGLTSKTFTKDCSTPSNCTIAEQDMYRWKQALQAHGLPEADAQIDINGDNAEISITWQEKATNAYVFGAGEEQQVYSVQVPL